MRVQIVGFTIGILLLILGVALLVPAAVDYNDNHANAEIFMECALLSYFFGGALYLSFRDFSDQVNIKQAFLLTTISWFVLGLFAAMPLHLSDLEISFTDALFESISGITTTGSTVLSGLDDMSRGVLIWRSITQFIGGIGVIAFAIVFLPFLRVGGMQLFRTESSDRSEKVMPKTGDIVMGLVLVYCGLTFLCALAYYACGMSLFDAVNHAMTTLSTGGYSTHDASFGYFKSPLLQEVAVLFMMCGGLPFVLFVKMIYRGQFEFHRDAQVRGFLLLFALSVLVLGLWLWHGAQYGLGESLNYAAFNAMSIITTTGYATTDYTLWGPFAITVFFFLTYVGACAGSTAGGVKTIRLVVALAASMRQIRSLIYPHGVFAIKYQGKPVPQQVIQAIMGFLCLFVTANVFLTFALNFTGLDFVTAISGAATAMANVGPGLGEVIGPAGNFSTLPDSSKWLLCIGMLLGRLEIMTMLVILTPGFWRK